MSAETQPDAPARPLPLRIASIDAYRGLVMLLMMAEVLSLRSVAKALPESGFWKFLAHHQSHADWMVGYWLWFALYPLPDTGFDWAAAGTKPERMLSGFAAHWSLGTNPAAAFDRWFVGLFPAERRASNPAGYTTLNFILTFATMILGLLAGGILRGERPPAAKIRWFLVVGLAALALGWVLNETGLCPMIKKTRTPSFVFFSGGWCFLFLAFFYQVVDVWGRRKWAFPLLVLGMNSIAAYLISHLWAGFISRAWVRHAGKGFFAFAGAPYERLTLGCAVLLTEWLILWWMHRNKVFLRI